MSCVFRIPFLRCIYSSIPADSEYLELNQDSESDTDNLFPLSTTDESFAATTPIPASTASATVPAPSIFGKPSSLSHPHTPVPIPVATASAPVPAPSTFDNPSSFSYPQPSAPMATGPLGQSSGHSTRLFGPGANPLADLADLSSYHGTTASSERAASSSSVSGTTSTSAGCGSDSDRSSYYASSTAALDSFNQFGNYREGTPPKRSIASVMSSGFPSPERPVKNPWNSKRQRKH